MNAETENVKAPAGAEDVIIRVEGLKRYYARGKIKALDGIDLSVRRGEVVVIIGPSGSGKSTLLRSLNLLEIPTAGSVFMEGMDITDRHADINLHRQKMGMVFQHFNLFPHMTVLRNMTLAPIKLKGKTREQAEEQAMELLGKVGLADRANAYPDQLSGGQKQRVAIVRALCMEPDGMLFDERTDFRAGSGDGRRGAGRHEAAGAGRHDHGLRHARDGLCPRGRLARPVHGRRADTGAGHPDGDIHSAPLRPAEILSCKGAVRRPYRHRLPYIRIP